MATGKGGNPDGELGALELFAGLSPRRLKHLARLTTIRDAQAGETLAVADVPDREVLLVLDGEVELTAGGELLAPAGPGDVVNAAALAGPQLSGITARTKTPARIAGIGNEELVALLDEEPVVAIRLVRILAARNAALAVRLAQVRVPASSG